LSLPVFKFHHLYFNLSLSSLLGRPSGLYWEEEEEEEPKKLSSGNFEIDPELKSK